MRLYIKEFQNFRLESVKPYMLDSVELIKFSRDDELNIGETILVTKLDVERDSINTDEFHILEYEEAFDHICIGMINEFNRKRDYFFLKNEFNKAVSADINTIITGSSYGVFDIENSMLDSAVNLSSISQDLYYSLKLAYIACVNNENIKNIVVISGTYYFFSDLSKTQNEGELARITRVYKPLLNDTHNLHLQHTEESMLVDSDIFDVKRMYESYVDMEVSRGYFNADYCREVYASKLWEDTSKNWEDLSDFEKELAAQRRSTYHNKNINHRLSLNENIILLSKYMKFFSEKSIKVIFLIAPATKYYLRYLDPRFGEIYVSALNEMDEEIHFWDFSESDEFEECDFNDTDHLNTRGAVKFTRIVNELIKNE